MPRQDPHSFADLDQGRIRELVWRVKVVFEQKRLEAMATLMFETAQAGPLDLDSRGLEEIEITDEAGRPVLYELGPVEGFMGSRLRVLRSHPTSVLTIRYRTSADASALQWLEPAQTAGGRKPFMFTQCQAIHARSIIPIQDTPQVRFRFGAELTVPNSLVAVMAAAPGIATPGGDAGWHTYGFDMPQPIPSYLLAFAVGDLVSRDLGPRTRVYAEREVLPKAAFEFGGADALLKAAEDLFGPYRWERFDFLVMPPAFPYGGMENPRLTFLTPTLLAGDRSMVNVLAHELAHSWTGNLVTNATMNDFWLNEGFTVWAERRILERLEGAEYAALHARLGWNGLQGALQQFGEGSPWTWLHTDLSGVDPDEVYSLVPYEKGYLFVKLLEETVGRPAFDKFIKEYIDHFAFQSITTREFVEYVEKSVPGLLETVEAEKWLHCAGIPANAPSSASRRMDVVESSVRVYLEKAELPTAGSKAWKAEEWLLFLQGIGQKVDAEQCRVLDEAYHFTRSGNSEILCHWLVSSIRASYEPAYPVAEAFLKRVGRGKYLKPLYRALAANPGTIELGRRIFAEAKAGYHPIVRDGLASMVG